MEDVFNQHVDWALSIARSMRYKFPPRFADDLEQGALFGLWQASLTWDGVREFKPYASFRIRGAIYDELREINTHHSRVHEQIPDQLVGDLSIIETGYEHVEQSVQASIALERLTTALSSIPVRNREILIRHAYGERQEDLATAYGVSSIRIWQIIDETRKRIHFEVFRSAGVFYTSFPRDR